MGTSTTLDQAASSRLASDFGGDLIRPDDGRYDEARKVYNAMIDRRPGLIARCGGPDDVAAAVDFARREGVLVSIRGGGHNAGGLGVCDDGLVIDLSEMRQVEVDPQRQTVRVQGGATWGEVDRATHEHGLAVPSGIISTTGVGGLTLGGGLGHLSRRFGLALDNLLSADMVLADGSSVTASEDENEDLFWAIRGGGGNFGAVTSFVFRANPVHTVLAGPTFWPLEQSEEALRFYDEFMASAPRDVNGFFAFLTVPPGDPFPGRAAHAEGVRRGLVLHGRPRAGGGGAAPGCASSAPRSSTGSRDAVPRSPERVRRGVPAGAPVVLEGRLRRHAVRRGDRGARRTRRADAEHALDHAPVPDRRGGARRRPGRDRIRATAIRAGREVIVGVDPEPANAAAITDWAKGYWEALHPHSAGGAYVNFLMHDEGPERVKATYRGNYDRLVEVKRRYDPDNLFRVNQNIAP